MTWTQDEAACTLHTSGLLEIHSLWELLVSDQGRAGSVGTEVSARRPITLRCSSFSKPTPGHPWKPISEITSVRKASLISPFRISYPTLVLSQHSAKTLNPKLLTLHLSPQVDIKVNGFFLFPSKRHRSAGLHECFFFFFLTE